jgi:hypothetical protein
MSRAVLIAAGVLAACQNNSVRQEVAPVRRDGAYDYVARVNGRSFAGVLYVVSDTLVVEATDGVCYYDPGSVSITNIRYKCEGSSEIEDLVLVFDRHNPVSSSHWSASTYRNVQHVVCDKYSTDVNGRTTCVSSHVETERQKETIVGTLTMKRSAP